MKILHKSKRTVPPPPQVAELISTLVNTPNESLAQTLEEIDVWKWQRSDLNAWIKVLNKFDAILEDVIREYEIDKLQVKEFSPDSKKTVSEILKFERLLLENSTNRKMFNSYDRLNSLLFTSDLEILVLALKLLLRPSQQYSAQPAVSQALNISTPRLLSLAKRWSHLREYGIDLVDLVNGQGSPEIDALPTEAREVNFSFYRTDTGSSQAKPEVDSNDSSSPRKPSTTPISTGAVAVHIDEQTLQSKSPMLILADAIQTHEIPDSEKFDLLCCIRAAATLAKGREGEREKLVHIRLLAIAIFGHTHPESQALSTIFLFEPDLIPHVAELLHVGRGVSTQIQTAAIAALDAIARYRSKVQEVLTSVNAGVNHGILMGLLRKTISDISSPDCEIPHSFVEALLSFVTFIASHASGGNMVVGAGLIPLLIQILENRLSTRLQVVSKSMQLIDNVLYSFANAFNLFCNSHGVEALVDRIEYEVDLDIREHGDQQKSRQIFGSHGELPVVRAAVLKHILRSMHRMMQSSGTSEGLRGLIDMSILKSIKKIIEYRGLFGPSVLPIAINIMATFVHNEPGSLAVIQEAGLPETFYKAIELGLEPAIEVIQAIPNAIGALCLNEVGQAQLGAHPSILPAIFSIFTSDRHLKILLEKENAVLIGTAIDELIRHHPFLKNPVFDALKSTMTKIEELGHAYVPPDEIRHFYELTVVPPVSSAPENGDKMEGVESTEATETTTVALAAALLDPRSEEAMRLHENNIISFIDILGRFLEGLFQHTPHCRDFISQTNGLVCLGRLTALPCLPYDFANSVASDSMVQTMRTLTEVATGETLQQLSGLVKESLQATQEFWSVNSEDSKLLPLVEATEENHGNLNFYFRGLITLHVRVTLLSDVFATAGYAHGRGAITLLQTLMNSTTPQVIAELGSLHGASIWENIVLKAALAAKGIKVTQTPSASPLDQSPNHRNIELPEQVSSMPISALNGAMETADSTPTPTPTPAPTRHDGPKEHNAAALKHLTHGLPAALSPFFQAMVKMFHSRRMPEQSQKKQMMESSATIADILLKHLSAKSDVKNKSDLYTYYGVMLSLVTVLLIDERTANHTIHTVQLLAFYRVGGIEAVLDVCRSFISSIDSIAPIHEDERSSAQSQELLHAFSGLKIVLHLLHPLISSKPLLESAQTNVVITRDKKDTDPDYFEPHNFLVQLRITTLPLLKDIWESSWLIKAPLGVCRSVVQTILELLNSSEEAKTDSAAGLPSSSFIRPNVPDESRIRQLTDMGFPRAAAEHALRRTHNNIPAATEILLANPFTFTTFASEGDTEIAPAFGSAEAAASSERSANSEAAEAAVSSESSANPEAAVSSESSANPEAAVSSESSANPEAAVTSESSANLEAAVSSESSANQDMADPESDTPVPSTPSPDPATSKTTEEWQKELDKAREPLRAGISRKALSLVDEHLALLFDIHAAFVRPSVTQPEAIQNIINDIKTFSPYAYDVQEQPLANRCRLLALVLCETPSALSPELRGSLMGSLLALLLSNPVSTDPERPTIPRWLAAHLLVTEALFTLSEEPRNISTPKEGEPIPSEPVLVGPALVEARTMVFDFCLRLLAIPDLPSDELLSTLRLFVLLTKNHEYASQFVKRDALTMLFKRIQTSPVNGSSSYIAIILRHVIEDHRTVEGIMRHSIKRYLTSPRNKVTEVSSFLKNCSAMALRDPNTFIQVTQSMCQLASPYASLHQLSLKEPPQKSSKEGEEGGSNIMNMQVDSTDSYFDSAESIDEVMCFLAAELMKAAKTTSEPPSTTGSVPPTSVAESGSTDVSHSTTTKDSPESSKEKGQQQYMCFLMQCMTELLFSYDSCKVAFLSYSPKKKTSTPAKENVHSKFRAATVNFLLSELVPLDSLGTPHNADARSRMTVSTWAMSVLVALCVDTSSGREGKEISNELIAVRKFVLESISRAMKEMPTESTERQYGRLFALSDLCHRLLTVRFTSSPRKHEDTQISKVMLEKNFVATLTHALSDVDLNYPNVRTLVVSILKPLEFLTKVAIKMSRAPGKTRDILDSPKAGAVSPLPSDDDEDEEEEEAGEVREETPDLYRHSALGMYGGEMEDMNYHGEDEDMDDDEGVIDEDEEMDYEEETGSEDTSNTEDEEEVDEDMEEDEGEEDDWEDEEEEEEEGLVPDELDEGNEDEEGHPHPHVPVDEDEIDEAEEMMWQDVGHDVDHEGLREEMDEEEADVQGPIQIIHEDDEEEHDLGSDEDFGNDLDLVESGDIMRDVFNFGDSQGSGASFFPRRNRNTADDPIAIFGRVRHGGSAPPEATTHPLLLDASSQVARPASTAFRGSRNPQRITASGTSELLQTIEELVGGGAVQLFHHIMTRGRGGGVGGTETIRLDMPAGAIMDFGRHLPTRRPHVISASVRMERNTPSSPTLQTRTLEPLLTLQRWAEEVKVLHGDFVSERASKLINHLLVALLPDAIEAAQKAKEEEAIREREAAAKAQEEKEAKERQEAEEQAKSQMAVESASNQPAQDPSQKKEESPSPQISQSLPEESRSLSEDQPMQDVLASTGPDSNTDADADMTDGTTGEPSSAETQISRPPESTEESAEASGNAAAAPRVTVTIHGNEVDITDTGIDPTFLEALPDDMREEVLNQHVRDQRAARVERPADSQISVEFLDALPPEIRAEIIQQEAMERARLAAEEAQATAGAARVPAEIDPASFIASLDPALRQAVLMEQDEGFIQTLPSHMIAEAGTYRTAGGQARRLNPVGSRAARPTSGPFVPRKFAPQHDAIQLLDKAGVAALVRLLFFPQVLKKTLMFKVLVNLCENAKTRTELFNLLLNILQDGTGDLAAVDKSFAQMSFRNSKTPKSTGKPKSTLELIALPGGQTEAVPDLIAQRCLEALMYIVTANSSSSLFFLTEHELPAGLRRAPSKKGKGKEKQVPQTHYPIVLLLGLLDRQSLLRTPSIMESVVGLLATVTRPIKEAKLQAQLQPSISKSADAPSPSNGPSPDVANPSASDSVSPASDAPAAPSSSLPPDITVSQSNTASAPNATTQDTSTSHGMPIQAVEQQILLSNPPQIPHAVLRLIVNILTVGECSSRTFQQSLNLIQHLSYIPDTRDVIAQELKSRAQEFGHTLFSELDELANALQDALESQLSSVASKFSAPSSTQAKLLRVLKTIDYMYSPHPSVVAPEVTEKNEDTEKVQAIYESFRFAPLWKRLGDCLAIIEEKTDTEHVATVLLPLIESLMVVCKYVGTNSSASRALRVLSSPRSPTTARESMEDLFVSFTDSHRKVLNVMVRNNPSLMSGSFSLLVHNPRVLDFDNKRNYFTQQLHRKPHSREHHGTIQLNIRRARVFEDSFQQIMRKTGDQIKYGKLNIRFYEEEGVDAGGLTREWFQILARQMFDPNNALFQPCAADKLTYQPNKNSWVNPEHLSFFKFVGRVIGKAIYDGRLLDAYFARSLYRQLLGKPVDYKDVEWVDPEYYNSLCWILENDPTLLELTFSVEADEFGVNRIVPLKEGGDSIPVTQENKREFVQLSAQYRLYSSIKDQIEHLSAGFYEIIPKDLITIFNEQELELLISGTPDIDVDEWRAATEYNGYTSSDPNIVWWWRALKSFNRDERAKVLSFATGTSRVPLSGFMDLQGVQGVQKFSIHRAYGESDRLPQAHTCFNQIDLPQYSSYEMLRQQVLLAINEGAEGFGFV